MLLSKKRKKELTGKHVLAMLLAFFGLTVGVNAFFIFAAVTSFRGEDVERSYRQGLEYNQTLSARQAQAQLGWSVSANFISEPQTIIVQILDAEKIPVNLSAITAALRHPTDLSLDRSVTLKPRGKGQYIAIVDLPSGQWSLKAKALQGQKTFNFDYNFHVS